MAPFLRRFCPDFMVKRIRDVDPNDLVLLGIKGVLLDLDNTLLPWKSHEIPVETTDWISKCKAAGLKLCLVSNTRNLARLRDMAETMQLPAVAPAKMKPSRMGFVQALEILGVVPGEAVMIGDQMFTDVWGGNRAGIRTIWVERMADREFFGTKFSRMIERLLSRFIHKGHSD
ncbi:MAG: YqeG family HAD IIIA-type phosphatase [Armatimonadota bacterium]|nr:YqeG family HAD IIIA-type phosphatase [Armatimonadota bacterium]